MNSVRKDPKKFAETVKKLYIDPVDSQGNHCRWKTTLREGQAGAIELYNFLSSQADPVPELVPNGCLMVNAFTHTKYMSNNNVISHNQETSPGNSHKVGLKDRLKKYGVFGTGAEAIGTLQKSH